MILVFAKRPSERNPFPIFRLRYLGFSVEDTAWVNSAIPVVDVVGPPIAGIIADKMGNFRLFMSALTFLNGVASLLLLAVPKSERKSREIQGGPSPGKPGSG